MRFETWRGMPLVFAMAACGLGLAAGSARADGYHLRHTIPRTVAAYDYTTGGEFKAPPVPYGHYAKDYLGCASCRLHGLLGCLGCGHEGGGNGCKQCGGHGCGLCLKGGHGAGGSGDMLGGGGGHFHRHKAGRFAPCDAGTVVAGGGIYDSYAGVGTGMATNQLVPSGTAVVLPSSQGPCGLAGCGVKGAHKHHRLCGMCGGKGCRGCHGNGLLEGCGDPGCGRCGGQGRGCRFCGGQGCSHCLSALRGRLAGLLHLGPRVDYFVGAGGPVPITPGYVPYIVVTRSPRDFFAFPPMNPFDP